MKYRRIFLPGGTFFFTVVTYNRRKILGKEPEISLLREAFRYTLARHPFQMDACVVLPDHIHAIWTMPEDDSDYSTRWRLIKSYFTHNLSHKPGAGGSPSRGKKGEQFVWQRRFWEHLIRDEQDL
jgi:putative transposase